MGLLLVRVSGTIFGSKYKQCTYLQEEVYILLIDSFKTVQYKHREI